MFKIKTPISGTIAFWYKKEGIWHHFVGIYENNLLKKSYLDTEEVPANVILVLDEPVPEYDLMILNRELNNKEIYELYTMAGIASVQSLPFLSIDDIIVYYECPKI